MLNTCYEKGNYIPTLPAKNTEQLCTNFLFWPYRYMIMEPIILHSENNKAYNLTLHKLEHLLFSSMSLTTVKYVICNGDRQS